jgi:histidinol-phosphate aminotransferase
MHYKEYIQKLPAYKAARLIARQTSQITKLSSNENPLGASPKARAAIEAALGALRAALAAQAGLPPEAVTCSNGSDELILLLSVAFLREGDEVVMAEGTFISYLIRTLELGARPVRVPLRNYAHDLPAMAAAITPRTRMVFVCNPNNPTGQVVTEDELVSFLDRVPTDVIVVLDEAYREFIAGDDVADGIELFRRYPNVVVLRTFSKAYGLAALRVGFAIAHERVAEALRKTATPFGVSTIAEEAAIASLDAEDELLARVRHLIDERTRVWEALREQGWTVHRTEANFVWLRLGDDSGAFAAACEAAGITVRTFGNEGVRVTIAEQEANDRVITVAGALRERLG